MLEYVLCAFLSSTYKARRPQSITQLTYLIIDIRYLHKHNEDIFIFLTTSKSSLKSKTPLT